MNKVLNLTNNSYSKIIKNGSLLTFEESTNINFNEKISIILEDEVTEFEINYKSFKNYDITNNIKYNNDWVFKMANISQTNRTILMEEINPEKLDLVTLVGDTKGIDSLSDEKIKEINENLLVSNFDEFLEKFDPVVYSFFNANNQKVIIQLNLIQGYSKLNVCKIFHCPAYVGVLLSHYVLVLLFLFLCILYLDYLVLFQTLFFTHLEAFITPFFIVYLIFTLNTKGIFKKFKYSFCYDILYLNIKNIYFIFKFILFIISHILLII